MGSLTNKSTGKVYTSALTKKQNESSKGTLTNKETGQVYEPSYTGGTTQKVTTLPTLNITPEIQAAADVLKSILPEADTPAQALQNIQKVTTGGLLPAVAGTDTDKMQQAVRKSVVQSIVPEGATSAKTLQTLQNAMTGGGVDKVAHGTLPTATQNDPKKSPAFSGYAEKQDFTGGRTYAGGGRENNQFSVGKLLGGAVVKGIDQAVGAVTSTAAWLENMTLGKLFPGTTDNSVIQAINDRVQQATEHNQKYTAPNVAAGGKVAEIIDKYGTATVAAIPQAALALYSGGASAAAQGTTAGLQAASTAAQASGGLLSTIQSAAMTLAKDPQYWLSFAQVAGPSYDQAKADGADDTRASLYALGNGLLNAAVEVGGGIQNLPAELQSGSGAFKAWVDSMLDEGKEEVVQGVLERGLQNLVYGKDNALVGIEDENAILNPKTAAEEFLGGAVVGGILGGAQTGINAAVNARANRVTGLPTMSQTEQNTPVELPTMNQQTATTPNGVQVGVDAIAQENAVEGAKNTKFNIDNAGSEQYNNLNEGGIVNERSPSEGNYSQGVSSVQGYRGADGTGRGVDGGISVDSGIVLLSPKSQHTLNQRGVVNVELHDSSANNAAFSSALDAARNTDVKNGWAVTPKTVDDLMHLRPFMDANGTTGFAIAQDSDIEAVFANKAAGAPKGVTQSTIPQAIANGGTKLDCYGSGLVNLYAQYGFTPVARTTFNPEYANDGWTADKGSPDIYFMAHNGDSADTVVENHGSYKSWTKAELDALPVMDYDSAYAYRDKRLSEQGAPSMAMQAEGNERIVELPMRDQGEIKGLPTMKGASIHEQTGEVSGRGQGRVSDQYPGGQAFGQRAGTEGAGQRAAFQSRTAVERQNRANGLWGDKVSSRTLGISSGTDVDVLTIMPESTWDGEMKSVAQKVKTATGLDVTYVTGGIQVMAEDGSTRLVRGVWSQNGIVIQADNLRVGVEQIADHEIFHDISRQSPGMVGQVVERIRQQYNQEEFRQVVETYITKLRGVVNVENSSIQFAIDDALRDIYEEICADAYAGINAFSAHAERYRDTAHQTVRETGFTDETRQSAAATEYTTGPPERFSVDEDYKKALESGDVRKAQQLVDKAAQKAGYVKTVYHGTDADFTVFDTRTNGAAAQAKEAHRWDATYPAGTIFLAESRGTAAYYGGKLMNLYLNTEGMKTFRRTDMYAHDAMDQLYGNEVLKYPVIAVEGSDQTIYATRGRSRVKSAEVCVYDDNGNLIPLSRRFNRDNADIRYSLDEELPGVKHNPDGTWQFPDGSTDIDTYTDNLTRRAAQEKAERMRNKDRTEFKGSAGLDKLGVRIDNSVGSYEHLQQLIGNDRAAKLVVKELKRAEQRLDATEAERNFASGIAAGVYTEADVPTTMDASKVMELADYYWAAEATGQNLIRQQRANINQALSEKMGEIMKDVDTDSVKLPRGFTLNHRTAIRNMITIFGDEAGGRLNDFLFKPVSANESERLRFVNRMYDEVRKFKNSKGKQRALSKTERAVVQQVMEGRAAAELVDSSKRAQIIRDAAENIHKNGDVTDAVNEFSLTSEELKLTLKYVRWLETQDTLYSDKVDAVKVENAVRKYSEMFDRFYDATNEFLVAHGHEPIGFIKGYAPHIQTNETQDLLNKAFKAMGLSSDVSALPASIAGRTANYKPNKRWNPFHQHRTGDSTQYDIAAGYETYVDYMSDILYHTDDIMRVRQASEYFRRRYAPENIRESLEQAEDLRYASTERKANYLRDHGVVSRTSALSAEDVNRLMDQYVEGQYEDIHNTSKYSDLVVWLDDYANKLAGKQLFADRSMERTVGRTSLNVSRKLSQMFARSKVAGNLGSALNQSSQLPMIIADNGARYTAAAVKDSFTGRLREFSKESDFLTEKKGVNYIVSTPGEMVTTALFKPLELADSLVSTMAVRGRYLKEINAGKSHAEAMKAADQYGRSVMGSRAKGSVPLAFQQKDVVSTMLHVFQVEAANSWEHLRVDYQQDFRRIKAEKGQAAAVTALAGVIVKMLLSAFILNRIDEELYGGTPAQFDLLGLFTNFVASGEGLTTNEYLRTVIDNGWEKLTGERLFDTEELDPEEEFDWGAALEDTAYNIGNDVPYLRNAMGLLGLGDETLPMPDLYGAGKGIVSAVQDHGLISGETGKAVLTVATEVLPGGNQISKTAQGIEALIRGGDYSGYGEDERLKYPLDDSVGTAVKSVLFGKSRTDAAGEYYASGASMLSAGQTQLYKSLVEQGADRQEIYQAIQQYRQIDSDKELASYERGVQERELIRALDLSDDQKLELYQGLTGADSRAEKFRTLMDTGLTWDEVMDAFEKYSELNADENMNASAKAQAFTKWVSMQGYTVRQTTAVKDQLAFYSIVSASTERYESLTETLVGAGMSQQSALTVAEEYIAATKDLTADKDANGNTIAGSKKEKVVAAIDGMDLTSAQKDALYLAEGYAKDGLSDTPWNQSARYTLPMRDWSQVTELPRIGG